MRRTLALFGLVSLPFLASCDRTPTEPEDEGEVTFESLVIGEAVLTPDPTGRAPLTARLDLATTEPVRAAITVLGDSRHPEVRSAPTPASAEHALPVLGLIPDRWNLVVVALETAEGEEVSDTLPILAGSLPAFLPEVEITRPPEPGSPPRWTLSDLALGAGPGEGWRTFPILFDEGGTVRWYLDLREQGALFTPFERLANGNLLAGHAGQIFEFDMLGEIVQSWSFGGEYFQHHDVIEKPDGDLIVAVDKASLETVEDHVVELDRTTGMITRVWDLREVLDIDRDDFVESIEDWLHVNSVFYDARDGGLVISARHQGVFKVSRENELVWILAPHRGWGIAGVDEEGVNTADFLLTAVDGTGTPYPDEVQQGDARAPDFDWGWGQHAAMLLDNGHMLIFDNGADRQFGAAAPPPYSRGVEYVIDPDAMTVRQVWAYGRERGADWFAPFVSDIDYLAASGNRLIMPGVVGLPDGGRGAFVTEVTPAGHVVFEARLSFTESFAQGGNPDLVYRSERMTPYPGQP